MDAADFCFDGIGILRFRSAVNHYYLTTTQPGKRFPKGSSRQKAVRSKRLISIDDHHIQITMKLAMLEAVVKKKDRASLLPFDIRARPKAVL